MNIVFICDRDYLMPTKVAINSIIKNKSEEDNLCIYVIGVGLSFIDFESIMQFQSEQIRIEPIIPDDCFQQISIEHGYVSKAALYKFLLPELIHTSKVLYLDSDILVLGSLRDLYEIDLGDMYAAVTVDMAAEVEQMFHLKHHISRYFNSGMMLLNLDELRKQKVSRKLIAIRQKDTSNWFMDQNTFNTVFDKKIILASPKYNYLLTYSEHYNYLPEEIAAFYSIDIEEAKKIKEHPTILHLTDKRKPWNNGSIKSQYIWYQYAFKEDFPQIIQSIVDNWEKENAALKFQLQQQQAVERIKLAQKEESILFYKNKERFIIKENHLSGVMDKIWKVKDEISEYLNRWDNKQKFVIYGAGRMARAVYKCLWSLGFADQVAGFVVSDRNENVEEMYGKKVLVWDEFEDKGVAVIIAVRDFPKEEIEHMKEKGIENILELENFIRRN